MTSSAKRAIRTPADDGWLFEELDTINTPSRADGVSRRTEALVNSSVAAFLTEASKSLQVPQITTLVAMKFFLRFYMVESLRNHRPEQVATACLFLSCKVNETHKRLRDIIYWTVKTRTKHTKVHSRAHSIPTMLTPHPGHLSCSPHPLPNARFAGLSRR